MKNNFTWINKSMCNRFTNIKSLCSAGEVTLRFHTDDISACSSEQSAAAVACAAVDVSMKGTDLLFCDWTRVRREHWKSSDSGPWPIDRCITIKNKSCHKDG